MQALVFTPSGTMAKGQVKVEVFADRLRLRWSFRGKRYCLSIGLPDSIVNRKVASQTAQRIELDMLSGNFDPSLAKYSNPYKGQVG